MKTNIIKDLKEKIVKELFLSNEQELSPSEVDIINICADIINSILDEKNDLEKVNNKLKVTLKNKEIEINSLYKDLNIRDNSKNSKKMDF